jgi:predicted Na+-dependent transporter
VMGIGVQHVSKVRQWCRFGAGNGNASTMVMIMQKLHISNTRKLVPMYIFSVFFTTSCELLFSELASNAMKQAEADSQTNFF